MIKYLQTWQDQPFSWMTHVADLRGQENISLLKNAMEFYVDEKSPALEKGLGIANILLTIGLDNETLAASLVYPLVQAQQVHPDMIMEHLNENIHRLISDALQMQSFTKLRSIDYRSHQIENLRKMLLSMITDVRAVLMILAERIWLLHEVKSQDTKTQQSLAQESFDLYAPLANRLGVWQLKWEIEDLCLRYLQPDIYHEIAKGLSSRRAEREIYVDNIIQQLQTVLTEASIKDFQISGRVKHIYSIYKKMQRKNAPLQEIYDMSALRVLVQDIDDCYEVLSVLQNHWAQLPQEFDDYIMHPKENGYRSIHTVILGPEQHYIEIQIRTYEMHHESELGVAAHWRYKEGILQPSSYEAKIVLLRQIMAWQKEIAVKQEEKPAQYLTDLLADRIYVFTPTGDIIDLPQGATPLDFAYHIHSEVGHRCKGTKVNGNIVPLTYSLQTGDRVEVLTAKQANPSRDWLNPHLGYLKTPRARAKAQHWFRMKDSIEHTVTGRALLEKELKRLGLSEKIDLHSIAEKLHYKTEEAMLAALAAGEIRLVQILNQLKPPEEKPILPSPLAPFSDHHSLSSHVQMVGINNLLTHIALCCKPLPGDAIIGYVTRTRGVSIHRRDCRNIPRTNQEHQERLMDVNWGNTPASYPADLLLRVYDRAGFLRDLTTLLSSEKINVLGLQTQKIQDTQEVDIYLTIEASDRHQLTKALELIHKIPNVLEVRRR